MLDYKISIILLVVISYLIMSYSKETYINTDGITIEDQYDDKLDKTIRTTKAENVQSTADVAMDTNKPYEADIVDEKGWYGDVINCKENGSVDIYCKPKDKWIFPY